MTMPCERFRAVLKTEVLLRDIILGQFVDEHDINYEQAYNDILKQAISCIRHYPHNYDMRQAAEKSPEVFEVPREYKERG